MTTTSHTAGSKITRCACCDLPTYSCGQRLAEEQAREEKARRQRALQEPGVVPAKFPGRCPSCRDQFPAGEPVRRTEDGWVSMLCCPPLDDD